MAAPRALRRCRARCARTARPRTRASELAPSGKKELRSSGGSPPPWLRASSLDGVGLELDVAQVLPQHDDRAVAARVPRFGEFESIGARELQAAFVVAAKAQPRERD